MSRNTGRCRSEFLKQSAALAAGAAFLPEIVPAAALGADGATAPSNRIVMGCIGVGGQGQGNMNGFMGNSDVQVAAVCDVDAGHMNSARDAVNKRYNNQDCKAYKDFRALLARSDIDAVSICTPDHWHGLASIAAAKAKKDIYCEKPLANSVGEGRAVANAVKENSRVLQTGSQERSGGNVRYVTELVQNGYIGKLHTIRVNLPTNDGHHQDVKNFSGIPAEQKVPEGLDFDFWLGHTPLAPYCDRRCHFWWRFILAHGGGEMTDRGAHVIDIAQLVHFTDDTGPVEFKAKGGRKAGSLYDAFMEYEFENVYADGVRMIGSSANQARGVKFEGDKGWIFVHIHGQSLEASSPAILQEKIAENAIRVPRSPGHHRDFLDCVKSRKQPLANAEVGHRTASICHLNNIAMTVGKGFKWDPVRETTDCDEANKLLTPVMRAPWKL